MTIIKDTHSQTDPSPKQNKVRLKSLDALRGFDMFWILGGEAIFRSTHRINGVGWLTLVR